MTTLPISIPPDFSVVVKKGDHVVEGDTLAKAPESSLPTPSNELVIDLVSIFNESANQVRKYLQKGPGDSVNDNEIVAVRSRSFGLKNDIVVSHTSGTVIRFERDNGKLFIQNNTPLDTPQAVLSDIVCPLAGTIKVCNNDSIVITPDDKEEKLPVKEDAVSEIPKIKAGEKGIGGKATGPLLVLSPEKEGRSIRNTDITKDAIGKIVLLPDIDKEAVAKAAAIGVVGILGTDLSADLFAYVTDRKIDLPIISIDPAIGKKLMKSKKDITINGKDHTVTDED